MASERARLLCVLPLAAHPLSDHRAHAPTAPCTHSYLLPAYHVPRTTYHALIYHVLSYHALLYQVLPRARCSHSRACWAPSWDLHCSLRRETSSRCACSGCTQAGISFGAGYAQAGVFGRLLGPVVGGPGAGLRGWAQGWGPRGWAQGLGPGLGAQGWAQAQAQG